MRILSFRTVCGMATCWRMIARTVLRLTLSCRLIWRTDIPATCNW